MKLIWHKQISSL